MLPFGTMALFRAAALLLSAGTALGAVQHGAAPPLPTHRPHNRALLALPKLFTPALR